MFDRSKGITSFTDGSILYQLIPFLSLAWVVVPLTLEKPASPKLKADILGPILWPSTGKSSQHTMDVP